MPSDSDPREEDEYLSASDTNDDEAKKRVGKGIILDGKAIAKEIKKQIAQRVSSQK